MIFHVVALIELRKELNLKALRVRNLLGVEAVDLMRIQYLFWHFSLLL